MILFVSNLCAFSQKMAVDYFDEAQDFYEDKEYQSAIEKFKYVVSNYPKSDLFELSYYNIAYIYNETKQYDSAMVYCRNIINSKFDDMQEIGRGIMENPYANYKHDACSFISDIYFERAEYDSSLLYLSYADTLYCYHHFCGNELSAKSTSFRE